MIVLLADALARPDIAVTRQRFFISGNIYEKKKCLSIPVKCKVVMAVAELG